MQKIAMLGLLILVQAAWGQTSPAKYPEFPSETPATLQTPTADFDYVRRVVMIPMRDGVKLQRVYHAPGHASFVELPVVTTSN
jgi:predicted acyl esterase